MTMNTVRQQFNSDGHLTKVITISTNKTRPSDDSDVIQVGLANIYDPWRETDKNLFQKAIWKAIDFFNPVMGLKVWFVLQKIKPDVIYTHNLKGFSVSVWLAVFFSNAKTRHVLHDYYLICSRCSIEKSGKRCNQPCTACNMYSLPKKLLAKFCIDRFIGVSKFIADRHANVFNLPIEKIGVINNARYPDVEGQFFVNNAGAGASLLLPRNRNNLFTFGFIGRAEPVKGIEFLFEALAFINFDYLLLIAGKECYPGYIDSLAEKYPKVKFRYLGFSNSKDFYRSVDCVVVPSLWHEPLGGVTYESMEFGVPVLGSRIGGVPEVVLDGVNGLLFDPDNVSDLVQKLTIIATDESVYRVLSSGTSKVSALFDPSRLKRQYEEDIS